MEGSCGLRHSWSRLPETFCKQPGLFRSRAAQADYEAGGEPNVVLVGAEERSAVVIGVENTHGKMRSEIKVHAAAHFHRKTEIRELQSAGPANRVGSRTLCAGLA